MMMESFRAQLEQLVQNAVLNCFDVTIAANISVIQTANKQTGADYQTNIAMVLCRQIGQAPQVIASKLEQHLAKSPLLAEATTSGPGFINLTLANDAIAVGITQLAQSPSLGINQAGQSDTIVVDYGGPNVAKAMHVGHLRSTVIGDAIVRILVFVGHKVIRQNHVGDWGTQFGMLIEFMLDQAIDINAIDDITELNQLYQKSKQRFDQDDDFARRAKQRVVALQSGHETTLSYWQHLVTTSQKHFQSVYNQLNVLLTEQDIRGESSYNEALPGIIDDLIRRNFLVDSQGAKALFLDGFVDKNGHPLPMLLQKADGGYLYATTDMATAKYRVEVLEATRLIYVTDARQKQHFEMLFAALRKVGYAPENIALEHVPFGAVLGEDRKPFKTRSGSNIQLESLIDEARKRALNIFHEKNPSSDLDADRVAAAIGIGALKYADLSHDKTNDYLFDWDQMLSFDGNTAPYLQNAVVRIASLLRKAGLKQESSVLSSKAIDTFEFHHSSERELALILTHFPETLLQISQDLAIHRLCHYLYELASQFHRFYEHCPILSETDIVQSNRLQLCAVTQSVLETGLRLLGIEPLEFM